MTKISNQYSLTNILTADLANSRLGINNVSPTVALDVTGAGKFSGALTLGSTISNGTYTYTLPSATGTLALTSALSGYLPLTGGTLTGALSGTSATFSSTINAGGAIKTSGQNLINEASVLKFSQESSTISQIASYGATTGTAGILNIKLKSSDASVDINALSFASTGAATFSGDVGVVKSSPGYFLQNSTSITSGSRGDLSWYNSSVSTVALIRANALTDNVGTQLEFYTRPAAGSLTQVFTLASTGAATFSSSVTMGGDLVLTPTDSAISFSSGAARFFTGGSERMRITSNGSVLINISSADPISGNGSLQVNKEIISLGTSAFLGTQNRTGSNFFGLYSTSNTLYIFNSSVGNIGQFNATSGAYTALSDANKKKGFEQSSIGLNEVLQLKPTLYRMKTDDDSSPKELGFIAQEVKDLIPQAYVETGEGEDKFIGLNQMPLIAALTKAIQELSAKVSLLENK